MRQSSLLFHEHKNAILLTPEHVGGLFLRLERGWDVADAAELYDLIVQLVLRDRLWLSTPSLTADNAATLRPWLTSNFLRPLPRYRQSDKSMLSIAPKYGIGRDLVRRIQIAAEHNIPLYVTKHERSVFDKLAAPLLEDAVCDLVARHDVLHRKIRVGLSGRGLSQPRLINFRIPPIPFEVIRRSSSLGDLVARTLDVRDEYSSLRRDHSALQAAIADPSLAPGKKIKLIDEAEKGWRATYRLADGAIDYEHAKSGGYLTQLLLSGAQFGAGAVLGDVGSVLGGLVGIGASANGARSSIESRLASPRWRLQPLRRSVQDCWNLSDRETIGHLRRVFGQPRI